jgi:hypothetical protein
VGDLLVWQDQDGPVGAVFYYPRHPAPVATLFIVRRREDHRKPRPLERLLDATDDLGEVRVVQLLDTRFTAPVRPALNARAAPCLTYPRSAITRSTRSRVLDATPGCPFITFETVGLETPAMTAISAIVGFP